MTSGKESLADGRGRARRRPRSTGRNTIFLAIPRPLKLEKLEDSPHCLDNLVEEFHDVFQDPPKGLPPLRGIEHQIDLITGSSLPNRPAYRTNPSETREILMRIK